MVSTKGNYLSPCGIHLLSNQPYQSLVTQLITHSHGRARTKKKKTPTHKNLHRCMSWQLALTTTNPSRENSEPHGMKVT